MEPDASPTLANSDPTGAFIALRGEVSLLRRAVEGLTAERQNAPDYTPTLTATSSQLGEIKRFMSAVARSPAMKLTPESLSSEIAKASATARAGDRDNLDRASASLNASIKSIDCVVEKAWTADRQNRWLLGTALAGVIAGIILCSVLPGEIARALPARWHVPEKMAARVMRMDMDKAGERLIEVAGKHLVEGGGSGKLAASSAKSIPPVLIHPAQRRPLTLSEAARP